MFLGVFLCAKNVGEVRFNEKIFIAVNRFREKSGQNARNYNSKKRNEFMEQHNNQLIILVWEKKQKFS